MKKNRRKIAINSTSKNDKFQTQSTSEVSNSNNSHIYLAAAVALLTLLVYFPSLKNGFLDWDDIQYVVENRHIRSFRPDFFRWAILDVKVGYWHPLAWLSHAIDYAVWRLNPLGHHLSSMVFHAINTAIIVCLTSRLLTIINDGRTTSANHRIFDQRFILIAAGVTGLLFGIHPLHVESVAWVAQRKDLLYALFYLLSIASYLRYTSDLRKVDLISAFYLSPQYYVTLGLFFLALCSKPMAVTLPAILLLLDWYPLKRLISLKKIAALIFEKIPFFVLSALISSLTLFAQKTEGDLKSFEAASSAVRMLVAFRGLMRYLWNIIAPINLLPIYPFPKNAAISQPEYLVAIVIVITITGASLLIARKQPIWLAAWAFFVLTLFPVLGLLQTGIQSMADRYMYLPIFGPFLIIGIGCAWCWEKLDGIPLKGRLIQRFAVACLIIVTILLSSLTVKQIGIWQSTLGLWDYYIQNDPGSFPEAYYLRGGAYRDDKQPDKAITDFSTAIRLDPNYAMAFIDRGEVLLERGQYDRSIEDSSRAIELNSIFGDAYVNRGTAYFLKGEVQRAFEDYNKAITKKPTFAKAYLSRGFVYAYIGESDNAIKDYSTALSLNPDLVDIYVRRGDLYMKSGIIDLAISDYQKACAMGHKIACSKAAIPFPR